MNNSYLNSKVRDTKDKNSLFSSSNESVFKIEFEKGKSDNLSISQNSNPEELAYNFCLKHKLDFNSVKELIKKIKNIKDREKENLSISSNIFKNKMSSKILGNFILNIKKNKTKSFKDISNNNSFNNINKNEIDNNKKIKENNINKNIYINSNNITPINFTSNYSRNNNMANTSDKNLNIFNFLSPTGDNNASINNIINNQNINLDYSKKTNNDLCNSISNNSIWTCNFNDSINDKINNLEKAYANFNPNNKRTEKEEIEKNNKDNNSKNPENTKEIVTQAIKKCLSIIEKEEVIENNATVSEKYNNSNAKNDLESRNKISFEINNSENTKIKSNSLKKNEENMNMKNSYITPKEKKSLIYINNKKLEENNNNTNIKVDQTNDFINSSKVHKESITSSINNNKYGNNNNKSVNDLLFQNKEGKGNINTSKEMQINNSKENEYSSDISKMPQIDIINNNIIDSFKSNINKDELIHKKDMDNNIKLDYYYNKFEKDNNDNIKVINNHNNNKIQNEINFSLLSNKNNFLISYSHRNFNNKRSFRRVLQKNYLYHRSYQEKEKKCEFLRNNNSIKNISNTNSFSYNNMQKDCLLSDNNINKIKINNKFSSLKTLLNHDNEKRVYSPFKIDKSSKKSCLLSFNKSERNMVNSMNKNNNKIIDNYNRTTTTTASIGYCSNNNSTIMRGSTNLKFCNSKNKINLNVWNKIPLNRTFTFSNEFLLKRQKGKENNSYYNNTSNINNNLFYSNILNNNKGSNTIFKVKNRKNKILFFSPNLNLNYSLTTNYSNNKNSSIDYLKQKTTSNLGAHYNFSKIKSEKGKKYSYNILNKTTLARNLLVKREIMNSFKNIFNFITKNNQTLDVFAILNRQNIPEELYDIIKKIVKNCNRKKRFIEKNEFINQANSLFNIFSKEEKIIILNYNKINW